MHILDDFGWVSGMSLIHRMYLGQYIENSQDGRIMGGAILPVPRFKDKNRPARRVSCTSFLPSMHRWILGGGMHFRSCSHRI